VALLLTACRSAAAAQENEAGAQLSIFLLAGHRRIRKGTGGSEAAAATTKKTINAMEN